MVLIFIVAVTVFNNGKYVLDLRYMNECDQSCDAFVLSIISELLINRNSEKGFLAVNELDWRWP